MNYLKPCLSKHPQKERHCKPKYLRKITLNYLQVDLEVELLTTIHYFWGLELKTLINAISIVLHVQAYC